MKRSVNLTRIAKACGAVWTVAYHTLLKGKAHGNVLYARATMVYLYRISGYSVSEICHLVDRAPTTVYYQLEMAQALCDKSPIFRERLKEAAKKLGLSNYVSDYEFNRKPKVKRKTEEKSRYHSPICKLTAIEELACRVAISKSCRFMEDYGKGAQPLKPGFATTRQ